MRNYTFQCRDNTSHRFTLWPGFQAQQEEVRPVMECPFVGCTEFTEVAQQEPETETVPMKTNDS